MSATDTTTVQVPFTAPRVLTDGEIDRVRAAMELAAMQAIHVSDEIREAVDRLYSIRLEGTTHWKEQLQRIAPDGYYNEGDEECPFFSERFLYPLLGKEDARTVLSSLSYLVRLLGLEAW